MLLTGAARELAKGDFDLRLGEALLDCICELVLVLLAEQGEGHEEEREHHEDESRPCADQNNPVSHRTTFEKVAIILLPACAVASG